jgi:hypothetical protein
LSGAVAATTTFRVWCTFYGRLIAKRLPVLFGAHSTAVLIAERLPVLLVHILRGF